MAFISVRNRRLCARCAITFLKIKQIPFSCRLAKRFTFLRVQKQFNMLLKLSIFLASTVSTDTKTEPLDGYVTTTRSIHGCEKCGAWLFNSRVPFTLREHIRTTKADITRFFLLKKMNSLPDEQLFIHVSYHSTKNRKKKCVYTTKLNRLL